MKTFEFIKQNIDKTTKKYDEADNSGNSATLLYLPYPYTTPCAKNDFQEMYYWDTYFTLKCLYIFGKEKQAKNNLLNFAYEIDKYGKILNGNRLCYLTRSQPPFFGLMVEDYLKYTDDLSVKRELFESLKKEYKFWNESRIACNGLNRYSCDCTDSECKEAMGYVELYVNRTGNPMEKTAENSRHVQAECESGWDFSPRFNGQCSNYNPIDLNCLLYRDECILRDMAESFGLHDEAIEYKLRADKRKLHIKEFKSEGIYYDYNYKTKKLSDIVSCAGFYPYFTGIDDNKEDLLKLLEKLERKHGVVACDYDKIKYQWSAPNSWAPLNYIAVSSLLRLDLKEEAKRLTDKYIKVMDGIYEKTNCLWEKYNGESGDMNVNSEYGTPEMLGWTAGVYVSFMKFRESDYTILV